MTKRKYLVLSLFIALSVLVFVNTSQHGEDTVYYETTAYSSAGIVPHNDRYPYPPQDLRISNSPIVIKP